MNAPPPLDDDAARRAGLPPGSRLQEVQLPSGLWIAAAEVASARLQRLVAAVGVGYLDEPDDCLGLAHLLEHMLFQGSCRFPDPGELSGWVGERGGRYNARTDESVTDVHLHLPPADADEGLARLVDMLAAPRLAHERIAHEVAVLDAEFRARLADPDLHRLAALGRLCHEGHPARRCHAGNRSTLGHDPARLAGRLAAFHHRHYRAGSMALVMLGPLPLEQQLALLARHGAGLPPGRAPKRTGRWRWGAPGAVAWCAPDDSASASALELFWPLPGALAAAEAERLAAVTARLNDGQLAATLQGVTELASLDVTLSPAGTGPALALRLAPVPEGAALGALLAGCRQAVARAAGGPAASVAPPPACLDAWPRHHACRLAGQALPDAAPLPRRLTKEPTERPGKAPAKELETWLAPERCRLLWQAPAHAGPWCTLNETNTRWRSEAWPAPCAPPPPRRPPALPRSHETRRATGRADAPAESDLLLWQGDPSARTDAPMASGCLGWPANASDQPARLAHWQRTTLALRQAAARHGMWLALGGDARGDWLMASGNAERLPALLSRALAAWPAKADAPRTVAPAAVGLIAQRLLTQLERQLPPDAPSSDGAQPLRCWVSGRLAPDDAVAALRPHLAALYRNPKRENAGSQEGVHAGKTSRGCPEAGDGDILVTPQGDDRVVMLEMIGEASPRGRWLFQLLAQCHDAAFQQEMRQRRGLGYVAVVRYREASGVPRLGYVVQSPHTPAAALRDAIAAFVSGESAALATLDVAAFRRRRHALAAQAGPPETAAEAHRRLWQALRQAPCRANPPWPPLPWEAEAQALAALQPDELAAAALALADGTTPRRWWQHLPAA